MLYPSTSPLVIGIGNEYRSDDALGLLAVRALQAHTGNTVQLKESDGDYTTLCETWQQARQVILVDALFSGARPGSICRFDVSTRTLPSECSLASTHAFGLADTLTLARVLGQLPPCLIIYGLEGEHFAPGQGLSPTVQQALPQLVTSLLAEIGEMRRQPCSRTRDKKRAREGHPRLSSACPDD